MCAFANYNSFWVPEKNLRVYCYKEFGKFLIQHTYIHLFKTIQDYREKLNGVNNVFKIQDVHFVLFASANSWENWIYGALYVG